MGPWQWRNPPRMGDAALPGASDNRGMDTTSQIELLVARLRQIVIALTKLVLEWMRFRQVAFTS
jgi:hypothetical protein